MKIFILFISLIQLNSQVNSKLTNEKRQELLNKLTRNITIENLEDFQNIENNDFTSDSFQDTIEYDPAKIQKIMYTYGFPESYNFFEETNTTIHIKDQKSCGCCWSHAATSALAYRYHLKGIDVNLSPQDALSCYLKDCEVGNNIIDSQLNLIKNGTLTEECFPFTSGNGYIEECPTSCKDGSKFKRYYAQNVYTIADYYSKSTFYDIVLIIMHELIENGPVVSSIYLYEDFYDWHKDQKRCHDDVYSYDGKSNLSGSHAVVIVGYGFLNNKYYWLIQNSWGDSCDHGFVKIEFGQIGVERVAFSEPYIRDEDAIPISIPVKINSLNNYCSMKVSTTSAFAKWENTLDIIAKNEKKGNNIHFLCGKNTFLKEGTVINCYIERKKYYTYKGFYKFQGGQSLGTENTFNLDKITGLIFYFDGYDSIGPIFSSEKSQYYYISEEGSQVIFKDNSKSNPDDELSSIYANINSKKPLSNCRKIKYNGSKMNYFIFCNI